MAQLANADPAVYFTDLKRPDSVEHATAIVAERASGAPEVLRRDFFNSLCASFTVEEVREQLREAGLGSLNVSAISDIHLAVAGVKRGL